MTTVILVLGNSIPEIVNKRLDRAILEYQSYQKQIILQEGEQQNLYFMVSGCGRKRAHEYMFNYASKQIDPKYIIVEPQSMNTFENLSFSYKILEETFHLMKLNIIICSSSFHMKRVLLLTKLLSKSNFNLKFIHTNEPISQDLEMKERKNIEDLLNEYTNYILEEKLIYC